MNINPINSKIMINAYKNQIQHKSEATNSENFDKVELSKEAVAFMELIEKVKSTEDLSMDKVNSIKDQIQKGQYHVETKDVADKIIAFYKR